MASWPRGGSGAYENKHISTTDNIPLSSNLFLLKKISTLPRRSSQEYHGTSEWTFREINAAILGWLFRLPVAAECLTWHISHSLIPSWNALCTGHVCQAGTPLRFGDFGSLLFRGVLRNSNHNEHLPGRVWTCGRPHVRLPVPLFWSFQALPSLRGRGGSLWALP